MGCSTLPIFACAKNVRYCSRSEKERDDRPTAAVIKYRHQPISKSSLYRSPRRKRKCTPSRPQQSPSNPRKRKESKQQTHPLNLIRKHLRPPLPLLIIRRIPIDLRRIHILVKLRLHPEQLLVRGELVPVLAARRRGAGPERHVVDVSWVGRGERERRVFGAVRLVGDVVGPGFELALASGRGFGRDVGVGFECCVTTHTINISCGL